MISSTVDRRNSLGVDEFLVEHLEANRPVVVADAMGGWRALTEWAPERLVERFGSRKVQVYDDLFSLVDVVSLGRYYERYVGAERAVGSGPVPYVRWYSQFKDVAFPWADDVLREMADEWERPYFLPESGYLLPSCGSDPTRDRFPGRALFISAPGARTRLHRDPWASDAILCQVHGAKLVRMRRPGSSDDDVLEYDLVAGDALLIPAGWLHEVDTVTSSVSVTWNFVHEVNRSRFEAHLRAGPDPDERDVLGYFLRSD